MQHSKLLDTQASTTQEWLEILLLNHDDDTSRTALSGIFEAFENSDRRLSDSEVSGPDLAATLRTLDIDQATIIAALLCDHRITHNHSYENLSERYGETIAMLVDDFISLRIFINDTNHETSLPQQAERLRRMLLSMVKDIRVVIMLLAWRLHQMRIITHLPDDIQLSIAHETLDIFTPLANRLGTYQLKWELEDLAFRVISPSTYKQLAKSLNAKRTERENYIEQFASSLKTIMAEASIDADVYGRPKNIYSIWKKMHNKQLDFEQLYDIRAVRVLVDNITDCYATLGLVHEHWTHVPEELDDYIANKKPNGYQSLHTVVIGPEGKAIEVQIRTHQMHALAEQGVASHWRYKEGGKHDPQLERVIESVRQLLDEEHSDDELIEGFQSNAFSDRVFTLTPRGDIMDLPVNATPLDFAYAIHTDIGHRCVGAKVNGRIVPLNFALSNSDTVEIMTQKEPAPKIKWLNKSLHYTQSSSTRSKIRQYFSQQDSEKNIALGKEMMDHEKHRLSLPHIDEARLLKHFKLQNIKELYRDLGSGRISAESLNKAIELPTEKAIKLRKARVSRSSHNELDVYVDGVDNLMVTAARCCRPAQGDAIVGYISIGRGVIIHRQDCKNIQAGVLPDNQRARLVPTEWGDEDTLYNVSVRVVGDNRPGLLRDVTDVLAKNEINVTAIDIQRGEDDSVSLVDIDIQVYNTDKLFSVLQKMEQMSTIHEAKRRT